jgi:uncharacterized membrane protein HdeD (DUF308 family)
LVALAYAYSTSIGSDRTGSMVLLGILTALLLANVLLSPSVAALLLMPTLCGIENVRRVRRDA